VTDDGRTRTTYPDFSNYHWRHYTFCFNAIHVAPISQGKRALIRQGCRFESLAIHSFDDSRFRDDWRYTLAANPFISFQSIQLTSFSSGTRLYLWGLVTLGSQFGVSGVLGAELYKEHELITSGPFAIIRHPLYAGVLLAAFGALLVFRTWAMVVFMPMSLVVVARAEREEEVLEQEFADEWEAYAAKVPKWFPIRR
jgi:protein-S-isoprenylcysteine O-methyltransferase Ste14